MYSSTDRWSAISPSPKFVRAGPETHDLCPDRARPNRRPQIGLMAASARDHSPDLVEDAVNRHGRDRHEGDPGQDIAEPRRGDAAVGFSSAQVMVAPAMNGSMSAWAIPPALIKP